MDSVYYYLTVLCYEIDYPFTCRYVLCHYLQATVHVATQQSLALEHGSVTQWLWKSMIYTAMHVVMN